MNKVILLLVVIMLLFSCNKEKKEATEESNTTKQNTKIQVNTIVVSPKIFNKQIISNGVIETKGKADLRFKTAERIRKIYVKNGQVVSKGKLLAVLDNQLLANKVKQAKIALKNAEVSLKREKIIFGIHKQQEKDVNQNILKTVYAKSGYKEAKARLENAQLLYQQTFLKAPFAGKISNLNTKTGNYIATSDVFCTLIGTSKNQTQVVFDILEQEVHLISKGASIQIISFADKNKKYTGKIVEINPLVDENGLIKVKATLTDNTKELLSGMHVKVYINKPLEKLIVIPKQALVLRSNKEVVFTVKNNLAKWNYVHIFDENASSYAIDKGLKIGDTIIISNNLNLAHDALIHPNFIKDEK